MGSGRRRKAGARLHTRLPAAVLVYMLVATDAAADGEGEGDGKGEGDWPIFSKVQRDPKGELSVSSFRVFQSLPIM